MRLVLFRSAALPPGAWSPFGETREPGDLLFGTRTLRDRIEAATGFRAEATPTTGGSTPTLLLDPRFVPEAPLDIPALARRSGEAPDRPLRLEADPGIPGDPVDAGALPATVGWVLPPGWPPSPPPEPGGAPGPGRSPGGDAPLRVRLAGLLLPTPWHLMAANGDRLARDLAEAIPGGGRPVDTLPPGVFRTGAHPITVEDEVTIDPHVHLDTRSGPIHLARGVEIRAHTRLEGPAYVGSRTRLLGGVFSSISTGHTCRLRGEIEASVIGAFTNKAHDGYLGHAVVGRWVNLGALTTNSDLKNTYGTVRVHRNADETVDSGMLKVGVLLGDHVKTGIGTLLNTGTVVGAGSNLFGGGALPPRWVPPFSWCAAGSVAPFRLDAFLEVAERAMARRGERLSPQARATLTELWHRTWA